MSYHSCDLCKPVVEQIIKPHLRDVSDDISHTKPIDLGTLDVLLGNSQRCSFHNFLLRMHDQVRPSFAIAPARGMPECSARNTRTSRVRAILATVANPNPSGKREVWSSFVDFVDERGMSVTTKWRAMFRLIAPDVASIQHDEGHNPTELGRLLDPYSACGPTFWRKSFGACLKKHKDTCGMPSRHEKSSVLPNAMRVLDLEDQTIKPYPSGKDYAVLSYVWGHTNFLQLTKANKKHMMKNESLIDLAKPKTIYDAMIVAQSLDIRYLWIDALCIIQDDEDDKMQQVHRMGQIYTNAVLTIVGARARHADGGLWSSEHRSQLIGEGGGLRWISAAPTLPDAVRLSAWSKRAWTYQEAAFSRRTLVFTEHQAYYSCRCSAWAEDYIQSTSDGSEELEYVAPQDEDDGQSTSTIEQLTSYPKSWSGLLEQYTNRKLTFESDVLIASAGVIASYLSSHNDVALCGLPVSMLFEFSLLWMPVSPLKRRLLPNPINEEQKDNFMFPSWSWAGWSGAIGYDATDHVYRPSVEAARVVRGWRFQCDDLVNQYWTAQQLQHQIDHFLSTTDHQTRGTTSLQTIQQGTLIISTLVSRLRIDEEHWNQFMESEDTNCIHTGYYRLFNEHEWVGSVHLEHGVAKELMSARQEVIVLSTTGGRGPTRLAPFPHRYVDGEEQQRVDETWVPLCDKRLIADGDEEMYNIMMVTKQPGGHYKPVRFRAGVGQVHKRSFEEMDHHRRDIWLE